MEERFEALTTFLNSREEEEYKSEEAAIFSFVESVFAFYSFQVSNGTAVTNDNVKITYKTLSLGQKIMILVKLGSRVLRSSLSYKSYLPNGPMPISQWQNLDSLCNIFYADIMGPLLEEHGLHLSQRILASEISRCVQRVVPEQDRTRRNIFAAFLHCLVTSEITQDFQLSLLSPTSERDDTLIRNFSDDWLRHSNQKYCFRYTIRDNEAELHIIPMGKLMQVMVRLVANGKSEIVVRRSYSFDRFFLTDVDPPVLCNLFGSRGLMKTTKNSIIKRGFFPLLGKSQHTSRMLQLPDQVLFQLWELFGWKELIALAKVSSKTRKLSDSVYLWKRHVQSEFNIHETETNWKYEFMARCVKQKKRSRRLWNPPPPPRIHWFQDLWGIHQWGSQLI